MRLETNMIRIGKFETLRSYRWQRLTPNQNPEETREIPQEYYEYYVKLLSELETANSNIEYNIFHRDLR